MRRKYGYAFVFFALWGFQWIAGESAYCQAWISPKHTGSVSISYLNELDTTDYFGRGEQYIDVPPGPGGPTGTRLSDFGELRTQGVYFDFAYSFTDKLALTVSLPYLAPKYTAPTSTTPEGISSAFLAAHAFPDGSIPLDDGHYHGSFQNFAFRLRYSVAKRPFLITPYVQYNQPSHDYLTYSHAIVGDGLKTFGLGSYFGDTLGNFLPNAYIQGNYSFSFVEEKLNVSRHFHLMEMEFGYFITPPFRAFTVLSGQITTGGLNAPYDLGIPIPENPLFFHHTQLTRNNYLNIGLGAQYSLSPRMDVYGVLSHMITARNLHGLAYGLTFGMSWGFGGSPQRPCHC